jgi:CRP/FNR family transcriptional regulator, anaerobic regulatory protein
MLEQIKQSISQYITLNKEELDFFFSLLTVKVLNKKELLFRSGQNCRNIYFINKGCIRYYYLVDGEEKTAQFFFENGWYTDYESFLSGDPSENFVDAIEDTELLCLEKSNLEKLYSTIPKFERFGRIMAENAYLGIRYRTKTLTNLTAEERYLKLIKERPKIFDRVPQYYIASYLNIKPQSLSRIRKNIAIGRSN